MRRASASHAISVSLRVLIGAKLYFGLGVCYNSIHF